MQHLLVGTRKGAWKYTSDDRLQAWQVDGPHFLGSIINHFVIDPRDRKTMVMAAAAGHLGPTILVSTDSDQDSSTLVPQLKRLFHGQGQGQNILVVDDEPDLALMVGNFLSIGGYEPTVLTDSEDALLDFTNNPEKYELLITDQTMPGLTGLKLIEGVKAIRPEIPVILCSGFKADEDETTIDRLTSAYITKPYRLR
ncbi:MAG: response regulator [Pseudomonadales bacterium]